MQYLKIEKVLGLHPDPQLQLLAPSALRSYRPARLKNLISTPEYQLTTYAFWNIWTQHHSSTFKEMETLWTLYN